MPRVCSLSRVGWTGLVVVCGLSGLSCSSDDQLNPVRGKVLYQNQPLKGALVTFHPEGGGDIKSTPPTGLTGEDGTFSLTTGQKAGAPAGTYVVTIICSAVPANTKKSFSTGGVEAKDRLKGAYANRNASKIKVVIKDGVNEIPPFNLK